MRSSPARAGANWEQLSGANADAEGEAAGVSPAVSEREQVSAKRVISFGSCFHQSQRKTPLVFKEGRDQYPLQRIGGKGNLVLCSGNDGGCDFSSGSPAPSSFAYLAQGLPAALLHLVWATPPYVGFMCGGSSSATSVCTG